MNLSKFLLVMGALFASFALAEVYKWVDEEGITQYGDCQPPDCVFEELELPKGPSDQEIKAARKTMRNTLEARKAQDAAAKEKRESETLEEQHQEQLRA